jgi:hypothetical protein
VQTEHVFPNILPQVLNLLSHITHSATLTLDIIVPRPPFCHADSHELAQSTKPTGLHRDLTSNALGSSTSELVAKAFQHPFGNLRHSRTPTDQHDYPAANLPRFSSCQSSLHHS